jgi:hypothetical protein
MTYRFSPSQLKTFQACRRKWYFEKVLKLRTPGTEATALGTILHWEIEKALGEDPEQPNELSEYPQLVTKSLKMLERALGDPFYQWLLDVPKDRLIVEGYAEWEHPTVTGMRANGRMDLAFPDPEDPTEKHWYVVDHKTSSNIGRYAHSPDSARKDPQSLVYAWECVQRGAELVTVIYAYHDTKDLSAPIHPVYLEPFTAAELREAVEGPMAYELEAMKHTKELATFDEVPRSTSACFDFGGCPFRDRCYGEEADEPAGEVPSVLDMISNNKESKMPFDFSALRNNQPTAKPAPTPAPAPEPSLDELPQVVYAGAGSKFDAFAKEVGPPPVTLLATAEVPPSAEPDVEPQPAKKKLSRKPKEQPAIEAEYEVIDDTAAPHKCPDPKGSLLLVDCRPWSEASITFEQWIESLPLFAALEEKADKHPYLMDFQEGYKLLSLELVRLMRAGEVTPPAYLVIRSDSPFAKHFLPLAPGAGVFDCVIGA